MRSCKAAGAAALACVRAPDDAEAERRLDAALAELTARAKAVAAARARRAKACPTPKLLKYLRAEAARAKSAWRAALRPALKLTGEDRLVPPVCTPGAGQN